MNFEQHQRSPRRLCQYQDGPCVEIVKQEEQDAVISLQKLEDVIHAHVRHDSGDHETIDTPPVYFPTHTDPMLLECWMDRDNGEMSLLGLKKERQEYDDEDGETAFINEADCRGMVRIQSYLHAPSGEEQDEVSKEAKKMMVACVCTGVASDGLVLHGDNTNNDDTDAMVRLTWVDVRHASSQLTLETQAGVSHFLRSLLGNSHAASPWASPEEAKNLLSDVVVLVCQHPAKYSTTKSPLFQVRVGDLCPSYYLHALVRLQVPVNNTSWWKMNGCMRHPAPSPIRTEPAMLLVFRKMQRRERIFDAPPENIPRTDVVVEELKQRYADCLWETYIRHEEPDEENEDDNEESVPSVHCRPLAPPYVSHTSAFPGLLEPLLEHLAILQEEAERIPAWTAWPERQHYSTSADGDPDKPTWTVFPLCHCFPSNRVEHRKWVEVTSAHVPRTVQLLRQCLGDTLRTALFSRLAPKTVLNAHTGWQDLANHVVRVHLPLVVPHGDLCGTWVDGCVQTHVYGKPLCFDDAKVHRAFNYSHQERVVLILDLARPDDMPPGYAIGGHSDELDAFIEKLT